MGVKIYKLVKKTAGGFHSWVESSTGIIRKPNDKIKYDVREILQEPELFISQPIVEPKLSFWQKVIKFIKPNKGYERKDKTN